MQTTEDSPDVWTPGTHTRKDNAIDNVRVPKNVYVEILTPQCDGIKR